MDANLTMQQLAERLLPHSVRTDPIRNVPRIRVRVTLREGVNAVNILGHRLKTGKNGKKLVHEIVIHEDELDAVKAKLEDREDLIADVNAQLAKEREAWVKSKIEGLPPHKVENARIEAEYKFDRQREPHNAAVYFFRRMSGERGIRPIKSYEVIEHLPPPKSEDERRSLDLVDALAQALARVLPQSSSGDSRHQRNK